MNKVEQYLLGLGNKKTSKAYKWYLVKYFNVIGKSPNDYIDENKNIKEYQEDVRTFMSWQKRNKIPPRTQVARLTAIRGLFERYDIELKSYFWKRIRKGIGRISTRTIDTIPNREEMRLIIDNSNIMYKAIFLICVSSGMRIGEVLQLKNEDIKERYRGDEKEPYIVEIFVRGETTKTGESRRTYITKEANRYLKEWKKNKEDYFKSFFKEGKNKVVIKKRDKAFDELIFPVTYNPVQKAFVRAVEKAGLGERDGSTSQRRYRIHIHSLRKYFSTELDCKEVIKDALMGHTDNLQKAYKRYTQKKIENFYLNGCYSLLIYEDGNVKKEISELKDNSRESRLDIDILQQKLIKKDKENKEMEKRLIETEMNMEKRFNEKLRVQGEYNQIINDIRRGKIKLPEYEKELIEDWGSVVVSLTDEDWDDYTEDGIEGAFETYTILERIRKKRRKK